MKMTLDFDHEEMCLLLTALQDLAAVAGRGPSATALLAEMRGELQIDREVRGRPPHEKGAE